LDDVKPVFLISPASPIHRAGKKARNCLPRARRCRLANSAARLVEITLSQEGKRLCVIIKDDGKGFEVMHSSGSAKTKFGLDIMRERAAEIGGTLKIESAPGKGCRITLNVPIENGGDSSEADACG
jgi:signal transduction histidine kinase